MADGSEDGRLGAFELERAGSGPQSKLGGSLLDWLAGVGGDTTLEAIIKVDEPGYVPLVADRRATISDTLFTANVQRGQLGELESDPRVVSIELNERLGRIDLDQIAEHDGRGAAAAQTAPGGPTRSWTG